VIGTSTETVAPGHRFSSLSISIVRVQSASN
jgi:hypothetical protein